MNKLIKILSSFIPSELANRIEADPDHLDKVAERRWVTALFADISGFTPLSEKLDPETLSELVNGLFARLLNVVSKYGGTVDKFLGDAIMVLFGAPVAHDDDPQRALDAALEMREEVKKFSRSAISKKTNAKLAVSIGINTGSVVSVLVGNEQRREYTVLGDAINIAARLEQLAGPWEIIVGNTTYEAVQGIFEFAKMPPLSLKGKSQKQIAWRLIEKRKVAILSDNELKVFYDDSIAKIIRQIFNSGGSLSIVCKDHTASHFWVKWIQSNEWNKDFKTVISDSGEPLGIIRKILGELPKPPDDIEERDKYISELASEMNAKLGDSILLIEGPVQEGTSDVLVKTNLVWIAIGPDIFPAKLHTTIKPLSKSIFVKIIKEISGATRISADTLKRLWELSGGLRGNLFALLDFFERRSILCVSKGKVSLSADAQLPGTISAYALSELDSLSPADRDAMFLAAVLGNSFPRKVFQNMTSRNIPESFFDVEGETIRFKWDFMQASIYGAMTTPTRKRLHRQAATAWKEYVTGTITTQNSNLAGKEERKVAMKKISTILAYHFYNGGMWRQAFENFIESARQSKVIWAFNTAQNYYIKAFEIIKENWRKWKNFGQAVETAFELGEVYLSLGDIKSAFHVNRWVAYNAQKKSQKGALFAALFRLGMLFAEQGKVLSAEKIYMKALEHSDPSSTPDLLLNIASLRIDRGHNLQALPILKKALCEARKQKRDELIPLILDNLGLTYHRIGRSNRAIKLMELSSTINEKRNDMRSLAQTKVNIASVLIDTGNIDKAQVFLKQAVETFEKIGDKRGYCLALSNLGEIIGISGRVKDALSILRKCQRISKQLGDLVLSAEILKNIGQCYIRTNELEKAERYFTRANEIFKAMSDNLGILESNFGLMQIMKKGGNIPADFWEANLKLAEKYHPQMVQKIKELGQS